MKKAVFMLTFLFLMFFNAMVSDAAEVLYSDIKAYVDGVPIRSYNIDGYTGIVAEDLRDYGFCVDWLEQERELYVYKEDNKEITAAYAFENTPYKSGTHAAYVYETDIKTYVAGDEIKAYNIGGYTVILIDELSVYGDVLWDENKREISFSYRKPWSVTLHTPKEGFNHQNNGSYFSDTIKSFSGEFVKNNDNIFIKSGENLEHISWIVLSYDKRFGGLRIGFSMIAHHLLADYELSSLCSDMVTINYDGTRLKENAYLANEHVKIYINGDLVKIKDVKMGKGNNHQDYDFILDADINEQDILNISIKVA